jgi:uncharacterized protein (TIGR01777 family)
MKVAISGVSGLIGSALAHSLVEDGHEVFPLVRRDVRTSSEIPWDPEGGTLPVARLAGLDAVVHLAAAGIGDKRWTSEYKQVLLTSRTRSTSLLARAVVGADPRPPVLLSASAIGFYGDTGELPVDEKSPRGQGFLAEVCSAWEAATGPAADAGVRVVHLRTGLVLSGHGGILSRLLPLYKAGLGGRLGTGRQYQSWISLTDEVAAIRFLLANPISGPVNLTAPDPVPQAEFARALAKAVHRPALIPTPAFAVRLATGQMGEEAALQGQRVLPGVLSEAGFIWNHSQLDEALRAELADS